jgi:hypothetical protein
VQAPLQSRAADARAADGSGVSVPVSPAAAGPAAVDSPPPAVKPEPPALAAKPPGMRVHISAASGSAAQPGAPLPAASMMRLAASSLCLPARRVMA